jgi:glycosyltransferase involved in cell wall biosynthesis
MLELANMQDDEIKIQPKIKVMYAITKGFWGGAQEYVFTLATSLSPEKYDVSVVCGVGETLAEKLSEKNIKTFVIGTMSRDISFWNEIKSFFALLKIIKNQKPDVLHLNSSKMGLVGGVAGRFCGVPKIIFTAHGLASNEDRATLTRKFFLFLHWLTIVLSSDTIAVSQKTKNDLYKLPCIGRKIFVVHNGMEKINFETKETARKYLVDLTGVEPAKITIGTISELHKNKGLDFLIWASVGLPDNVSVFIIGEGEERKNLETLIKNLNLQNKVFLVGKIFEARRFLKAFDIFTLTSRTESLPYVLLEAGLAGLPVIASRVGGIPEIVENQKNGILVEAGNISEISKSLKNLVLEPRKREIFADALQEKVEKEFSLQKMISETEIFY